MPILYQARDYRILKQRSTMCVESLPKTVVLHRLVRAFDSTNLAWANSLWHHTPYAKQSYFWKLGEQ